MHGLAHLQAITDSARGSGGTADHTKLRLFSPEVLPFLRSPSGRALLTEFLDARMTVERAIAILAAARHTRSDRIALQTAMSKLEDVAHAATSRPGEYAALTLCATEALHEVLARTARNRFLAMQSHMFACRLRDAGWLAPQLGTPAMAFEYQTLVNAVGARQSERAGNAAVALSNLVESWIWRGLARA